MKAAIFGPIAALVIGGAAGFIAGKNTAPVEEKKDGTSANARGGRRSSAGSSSNSGRRSTRATRVKSLADAMAIPGQNSRLEALMDYYAGLSPSQFEEEASKLDGLPWSERIMVGYLLFSRWGEEDPLAALAHTKTMGFAGMFVSGTVMQSWAAKSPQEAADYYTDNPNEFRMSGMMGGRGRGGGGSSTAGAIAAEWARQDSAGAMAWAQSLEGRDQSEAMKSVFTQAAKDDPSKAAGMLSSITDAEALKDAQKSVAREWGKQNWTDAKSWIAGLPADQQAGATAQALRGLADENPSEAALNISAIPEGQDRDDAMESIARQWSREDPAAAAAWVMESGSEGAQKESIGGVMPYWVQSDSTAALSFVNEQPEGTVRDNAATSYVMANRGGDVKENLSLAETIGDDGSRRRAIGITTAGWMQQDPEAATSYLENTEAISQESKDRIKNWGRGGGRGRGGRGR